MRNFLGLRVLPVVVGLFFLLTLASDVLAHGHRQEKKIGILLVAFGTTYTQAQKAFTNIERKVRQAFPGIPVYWAYTSKIIRHKLAKKGQKLLSPAQALAKMMDEGFTHVAVQSLHTIPGAEYDYLVQVAQSFSGLPKGMQKILVGHPLLATHEDFQKTVQALLQNIPTQRKQKEAVVFMGHGTHHLANACYPALQYYLWQKDKNIFVGTVEGAPSLEDTVKELKSRGIKKAYLLPFMSVAGDHARNDMAGDEPDSWKSVLTAQGIECIPVLKGTAEYDQIVDIWVEHLKAVMDQL